VGHFKMPDRGEKSKFVRENFEKIASHYDRFNDWNSFFLHRSWKNTLVRWLQEANPESVLDLCCGTGDIAFRISKLKSVRKLYAVDFSPSMLAFAKERLQHESTSRVVIQIGDAMDLKDWENSSLDAVTMGFGLRNVQDLRKCLREIHRILKPGGLFLNLDVGKVQNPAIRFFADFYFFRIVPWIGYALWGGKNEMFDYLPVSSLSYPSQEELKTILQQEGFTNIKYKNFAFGNAVLHSAKKEGGHKSIC